MIWKVLAALTLAVATVDTFAADSPSPPEAVSCLSRLEPLMQREAESGPGSSADEFTSCLIELGEAALPILEKRERSAPMKDNVAYGLAIVGGPKAVADLRKIYSRDHSDKAKALLCFALASTGSEKDRVFLIKVLEGKHYGDSWFPLQVAAYSLGVLRAQDALSELQKSADMNEGFASAAAKDALRWIKDKPQEVSFPQERLPDDDIIAAIIKNGVPRMDAATAFVEGARTWKRTPEGNWSVSAGDKPLDHVPSLVFHVVKSRDDQRAIVSVTVYFGNLNASGFDFLLERRDHWVVRGLFPTWVS
jgi:hypothetical protein